MKQLKEHELDMRIKSFLTKKFQQYPELAPRDTRDTDRLHQYETVKNVPRYFSGSWYQFSL
jgi:hypothetical protein